MTKFDYFIILADMRTGSNFLESNLNAVDGLSCLGEAFNPGFIGYPMQEALFGISLDQREADPQGLCWMRSRQRMGCAVFGSFTTTTPACWTFALPIRAAPRLF
jgi:hypothetical protein